MNDNIELNNDTKDINNKIMKYGLIAITIIIVILGTLTVYGAQSILNYDRIYNGVYVGNVNVSGLSKEAAIGKIENEYRSILESHTITLKYEDKTKDINLNDIDVSYDINKAVKEAYGLGRRENAFKRLYNIYNIKAKSKRIPFEISANEEKIEKILKDISKEIDSPAKEYKIVEEDQFAKITNPVKGKELNINKSKDSILEAIEMNKLDNDIQLQVNTVIPDAVTAESVYNKIFTQKKDATYEVKDYKLNIISHVVGKAIDKEKAQEIIASHQNEGEEYTIPVEYSEPELLKDELEAKLFKDSLSKFTSHYNANYATRSHNIALAASSINDVVLGPGDEFSFNDVVGERSIEKGYQVAHVYFGGEIIDGVGGGICQVSTTTYNAALFSNLEILERSNHSMTVSYVPLGQDAAVSYGTLNLKFKNTTKWPITIKSTTHKGSITIELLGTGKENNETIEIENEILRTIPYEEERVPDSEMYVGEEKVKQNGGNGYVVKSYKITKVDDEVVKKEELSVSRYRPINKIILVGTKEKPKPEVETEPVPFEDEFKDILDEIQDSDEGSQETSAEDEVLSSEHI